jgi:hypothetical protein
MNMISEAPTHALTRPHEDGASIDTTASVFVRRAAIHALEVRNQKARSKAANYAMAGTVLSTGSSMYGKYGGSLKIKT